MNALVVENLNPINMTGISSCAKKIHAKGIKLADARITNSKSDTLNIDMIIGNDYYYKLINHKIPTRRLYNIFIVESYFGACLAGPIPGSTRTPTDAVNNITLMYLNESAALLSPDERLDEFNADDLVKNMSDLESVGIKLETRRDQDEQAYKYFKDTVKYDAEQCNFTVGFPWKQGQPPEDLPDNYHLVRTMFKSTMSKLDKDPVKRTQYKKVHENEVLNKFIERIPENELNDVSVRKHWLHHFPVFKTNTNSSTPCRRVFNASLRKKNCISLNDAMWTGTSLTPHLLKILMRIRVRKYLLCSDVSKAFLRVILRMLDRNYTLFFIRENWEDPLSPLQVWRFCSVIFGSTASPFLLNATIIELLEANGIINSLVEIYVDNLFSVVNTVDELNIAMEKTIEIFDQATMPLHEWCSNSPHMNKKFQELGIGTEETSFIKTLGYIWDFVNDTWKINKPEFIVDKITKRSMLSNISSLYDPIGLATPIVLQAKVVIQKTFTYGFTWDDLVSDEIGCEWKENVEHIKLALEIEHKRFIGFQDLSKLSLHVFADAGADSFGCVAYIVGEHDRTM